MTLLTPETANAHTEAYLFYKFGYFQRMPNFELFGTYSALALPA